MANNSTPVQTSTRRLEENLLREDIRELLLRFKYCHLISDVLVSLFDLNPSDINNMLNELKLTFNKAYVVQLLIHRSKAFNVEKLKEIHLSLQLYRTAFFSKHKMWSVIKLLDPAEDLHCEGELRLIRRNILQALRIKGLNAVLNVIEHEEMVWVMIIEKKLTRRRGIKLIRPVFICYEVGTPYIFVNSAVPLHIMECILRAMQYKSHKVHQLEGKDVKSLLGLLKHKENHRNTMSVVTYQPADAEIGHRSVDFTKKKARESYANKLFHTAEPVELETLTVKADAVWRPNDLVPEMCGERFVTLVKFKSNNLIDMMKYMIANDIVATPLPAYMQTVMTSAKNKIVVHAPQGHNVSTHN